MSQKVYITMTGVGRRAVLDGPWAATCKGYVPDKVCLFVTKGGLQTG